MKLLYMKEAETLLRQKEKMQQYLAQYPADAAAVKGELFFADQIVKGHMKMCGRNGDKYEVKKSNVNCRSNGNGGGFYRLW